MIAIVDRLAQHRVDIGAATPACLWCAFIDFDARAFFGQCGGAGKPGETGADDMERAFAHPMIPLRSRIMASCDFGRLTRVRGGAQPSTSIADRIAA